MIMFVIVLEYMHALGIHFESDRLIGKVFERDFNQFGNGQYVK